MKYLVAFHALSRSGKTTAAEPLIRRGFFKASFGDAVYEEVSQTFGVTVEELRSDEWKAKPINLLSIRSCDCDKYRAMLRAAGEDMSAPRTSRYHLQRWATEYRRGQDPLYWVKIVAEKLRDVRENIVIDDLRFVDTEHPYLRELAAKTGRELRIIEILAPWNTYDQKHVSDAHLPFHLIDHVIENIRGYPEVLRQEVENYLYPTGE
jgi:hypothetical protein